MPAQPFPGFSDPSVVFVMALWLGLVAQPILLGLFWKPRRAYDDGSVDGVASASGYRSGAGGEVDIARRFHNRYSNQSPAAKEQLVMDLMRKRNCSRAVAMRWALGEFKD